MLIGPETASLSAVLDSLPVTAATSLSPTLDSVFTATEYRVRLRSHWLIAAFRVAPLEYAITPVPPGASDLGFSFSESDCVFRRASDGVPVLKVQRAGSRWSLNASHVIAAPSGAIVGTLEHDGADWNVFDAFCRLIARVEEVETRKGYFRYGIRVDQTEVCRFTWAMHGLGVWTAEMDIEFFAATAGALDPVYALALAPILEAKARRTSQRMN